MPILAGLLVSISTGLAAFIGQYVTKKVAVGLAAATTLAGILGALLVFMRSVVNPLTSSLFSTAYGQWIGLAFPPMTGNCVAIIASTWAACTLYAWQKKALELFVQA